MTKIELHVGENFDHAALRVADAWNKSARGKRVEVDNFTFANWDLLVRVLSKQRYSLLSYVRRHPVKTIAALARAVKRDYRIVQRDVGILSAAGLIERTKNGLRAPYDTITSRIML